MTRIARIVFPGALLFGLPFAVFHWLVPGLGPFTLGNDYSLYSFLHQLELQFSVAHGSFPLFCPGFLEGSTCSALTLGQSHHPLPYLARLFPGYWSGHALTINTMLRLAELGLAHVVLFRFLDRVGVGRVAAFVASFVAIYNLRMLDMFRYGASLENYVAFVLLCAALGSYWLDVADLAAPLPAGSNAAEYGEAARVSRPTPSRGAGAAMAPLGIAASVLLLAVGGHPQMMHQGLLGAAVVGLMLPFVVAALRRAAPPARSELLAYWGRSAAFVGAGLALAAPYLLQFYFEYVRTNASRVGREYEWSVQYSDSWGGAIDSFFAPLRSDVHGAFGGSGILVAALLFPLALALRRGRPRALAGVWALVIIAFLVTIGPATPLHRWFWTLVPFASSYRVPGRIGMIIPVLAAFVLSWLLRCEEERTHPVWLRPAAVMGASGALALVVFDVWGARLVPEPSFYTPPAIAPLPAWVEPALLWMGVATLVFLAARSSSDRPRVVKAAGILLCAAVVLETGVALRFGTWVARRETSPTLAQMEAARRTSLSYRGPVGVGSETTAVRRQIREAVVDPWLARFFRSWRTVAGVEEAYAAMATGGDAHTLVVEDPQRPSVRASEAGGQDRVSLAYGSFNLYRFAVSARGDGFLTVSFPRLEGFTARVDGSLAPVRRANGYQIAVPVPSGEHLVELRYWSASANAGMVVALVTLVALAAWFAFRSGTRTSVRVATVGASVVVAALAYVGWRTSLYGGDDLGTKYEWTSELLPRADDLAYGRRTAMSSKVGGEQEVNAYYSGRGVDGAYGGEGFATSGEEANPWWQVDLGEARSLGALRLHGAPWYLGTTAAPLEILSSLDGLGFRHEALLAAGGGGGLISTDLQGTVARFVRLRLLGLAPLSLTEVEIFPPRERSAGPVVQRPRR